MRLILSCLVFLLAAGPVTAQPRPKKPSVAPSAAATNQVLPLKKVVLYSNGVAYFERRGTVSGKAEISLNFKQSQIDDVLKSLVVLDLGKGRINTVSYNSSLPPSARLSEIPFSIPAGTGSNAPFAGLAGVLRQLQGARVAVATATRTGTGVMLTVEEKRAQADAAKPPVTTQSVTIAGEGGEILTFDLSEVKSVRLLDEGAQADVMNFARASASTRRRDSRTVTITSEGEGPREVVVSYTIAAPIWKTSYRVVLDTAGKPFFQGWAIVDNISEEDWDGVSLSLVSGSPMSFIQPIQQPMYRYRQELPLPTDVKTVPQNLRSDSLPTGDGTPSGAVLSVPNDRLGTNENRLIVPNGTAGPASNFAVMGQSYSGSSFKNDGVNNTAPAPISSSLTGGASGVETAAKGNEIGELFEYRISQPVTVRRDRSALIPIVQEQMDGERVSVFNEQKFKGTPVIGVRMLNTSKLTFEAGPLTVLDGDAYAGEAILDRLKPNDRRFITFAMDLGTTVTSNLKTNYEPVFLVRTQGGNLYAYYFEIETRTYKVVNQSERPKTVYIERPARQDWDFQPESAKPASTSPGIERFRVEVGPNQTATCTVVERRQNNLTYALLDLTQSRFEAFVNEKYLDEKTKAELEKILDLKKRIAAVAERLTKGSEEIEGIETDQKRLRENISVLGNNAEAKQLIVRYVAKVGDQETRLEQLRADLRAATEEKLRLEDELNKLIFGIVLERKLE